MSIHANDHLQAGEWVVVTTRLSPFGQSDTAVAYRVDNWWDNYALRAGLSGLPTDDEVVYGDIRDGLGHLVHVSEIVAEPSDRGVS